MALVIPPGFANWRITLTNGSGGASQKNTIAWATDLDQALTQAEMAAIANIFRDELLVLLDNSWIAGPVDVVYNIGGTLHQANDTGTEAGTHSSEAYAPPAIAHVVQKRTGLVGKAHRGRLYFPGVPEADVDESGTLDGSRVNEVTTAFDDLRAALALSTRITGSYLLHDSESPGALPPDLILESPCTTTVGSMRPRQRR